MGENIYKSLVGGQHPEYVKDSYKSTTKKPNFKIGKELEQIVQNRYMNGQETDNKMLNIINHQGNANQITVRQHLLPIRMAIIKKQANKKISQNSKQKTENKYW